jgi:formylglycine-generating enzyme required for sulfatase activity
MDSIVAAMVEIPAGRFQMGCSPDDSQCHGLETPAHQVTISPFRIGKYEVTQAQWQAVMGENPARAKGSDRPVANVSWDDAQAFLKRLNSKGTGKPYRLPTEAEWEYAARAGTGTPYWWGKTIDPDNANYGGLYAVLLGQGHEYTDPVGSFKPNAFGLYDTVGNVSEWVQDCLHSDYTGAPADGSEWRDHCILAQDL